MILPTARSIALIGAAPLLALLLAAAAPELWALSLVYLGVVLAALLLDAAMAVPASRVLHRVLLPEMSRRLAGGDSGGAFHAQNRTMALTIALAAPFVVAFLMIPDEIMRGVFLRGRFTAEAADASAAVLAAYGLGLAAVDVTRPLPFSALPRPVLSDLVKDLMRRADPAARIEAQKNLDSFEPE